MEINITRFFNEAAPMDYSASCAEIGMNAGRDTWNAAMEDAGDYKLLTNEDDLQEFRDYIKGFGAWNTEEIAAMSDQSLNALLIQFISGDIRESRYLECNPIDWDAYNADDNENHNIYKSGDDIFYMIMC
jgi:hypothetical protein